jgi:DNA-binding CsgD family transcriptional regulator
VAVAKMKGCTNEEIAKRLKCSVPTIERKLGRIGTVWGREMAR